VNPTAIATIQRCEVSHNTLRGLSANSGATLRVAGSTIVGNSVGVENVSSSATVESFGNNVIRGNTSQILGAFTPVGLQ
jgi:hypothetical protein